MKALLITFFLMVSLVVAAPVPDSSQILDKHRHEAGLLNGLLNGLLRDLNHLLNNATKDVSNVLDHLGGILDN